MIYKYFEVISGHLDWMKMCSIDICLCQQLLIEKLFFDLNRERKKCYVIISQLIGTSQLYLYMFSKGKDTGTMINDSNYSAFSKVISYSDLRSKFVSSYLIFVNILRNTYVNREFGERT